MVSLSLACAIIWTYPLRSGPFLSLLHPLSVIYLRVYPLTSRLILHITFNSLYDAPLT